MSNDPMPGAMWIARTVPAAQRISRATQRDRIDWVTPGHVLVQTFIAEGPVTVVNVDIAGPEDAGDPFTVDVKFTLRLEDPDGQPLAELVVEGEQLLWERFGRMIEVSPPAPAGEYRLVLTPERHTIGWWTANSAGIRQDDGISPLPIVGQAFRDDELVDGVRLIGVETTPAPNPVFRRVIHLDALAADATFTASVLGAGVVRINGVRVGDEMLEPAVTDYDRTVLYRSWPVAHLLRRGDNEVVIEAGRERYAARGGDIWGWNLAPWHREPVAIARLSIRYEDGQDVTFVTDDRWETAAGPVDRELLFGGEDWVLRAEEPSWTPAQVVEPPRGRLREATHPPVLALAPEPPVVTDWLDGSTVVYDFGAVMTGRIRCLVTGAAGAHIVVTSGEQRAEGGRVQCENTLAAGAAQQDTLRLDREVVDYLWEPQFSYRGFRWMQVETIGEVTARQVRAVPLYSPLEVMGEFHSENPLPEWVDSALARTFRNNLHGIPTDTPIYEKNGWTADAHLATEGLLHHFDLRSAFGKWMDDHVDSQAADGSIPQIVPTPGWGRGSDPAWSSSAVLIPWYLYREYGDLEGLARYSDMIRRYADQLLRRLDGGLWTDRSWGDWLAPGYGVGPEGMAPIGTIMTATALQHTSLVLQELGREDADAYGQAAANVGEAYHSAYFDAARGLYRVEGVSYRQALNVLPLAFQVVPDADVASVRANLINDLEGRTGGHLDCGAVAVRHLLPVLSDAGRDDLALTVLSQRTRPGWGVWFDDGEHTLLESFDADARSRNHYFLGSIASWIQQRIGGMQLTAPGWASFTVAPIHDDRVRAAHIRHRTPRGLASVDWKRGPGGWEINLTVPTDSIATVKLGGATREIPTGTHRLRLQEQ